ncbi:YrhK-like protein [Haloactinopolyspora alba]|uniref:YrhK-like protein n=1 Tax=Haloactinopolyspora alba TaxID=648780 RepID=A0A2P8DN80_9ACTN|nr:YrhK family protein [Haloactinopolyspora alba]PSK98672.1 YrhK-like protein [Haloactinopolyspora alba]
MSEHRDGRGLTIRIGHEELVIRQRYETASIVNDILIAVWFIVGSVMFFSEAWTTAGTWCFLIGSVELLIRPVIRLGRQVHLRRIQARNPGEAAHDF